MLRWAALRGWLAAGGLLLALAFVLTAATALGADPRSRLSQTGAARSDRVAVGLSSVRSLRELSGSFRQSIVGGTTADAGTFPSLAFIYDSDNGGFSCTGTVVSPDVVLTAGHCAVDETTGQTNDPAGYAVVTGTLDWSDTSTRQVSGVADVIPSPGFNPRTVKYDAALLVLATPTAAPALPLASPSDLSTIQPGAVVAAAGWGLTTANDYSSQPFALQWMTTVLQRPSFCSSKLSSFFSGSELCAVDAPYYDTAVCFGDSGGPLIADQLASQPGDPLDVGITSRTANCDPGAPDVYTRVDAISGWANRWISYEAANPPSGTQAPPTPSVSSGPPSLPRMSSSNAAGLVAQTLTGAFHGSRHSYRHTCLRDSSVQFVCGVDWWTGANDYWGTVTVWYELYQGSPAWNDHYSIRRVNDECYWHSGHRSRCRILRATGSW